MRFVSKNSNLMIVLSPGLPAQPLAGIPSKSGLYIKFKNGVLETKDEDIIAKMKAHPAFNSDFIAVEEDAKQEDPFEYLREEQEPVHVHTEIKYGHAEKSKAPGRKTKVPPELQKMINDLAMEKVKELLPDMVKMTIEKMAKASKAKADEAASEKKEKEVE